MEILTSILIGLGVLIIGILSTPKLESCEKCSKNIYHFQRFVNGIGGSYHRKCWESKWK